jgi:hypothetical protein
MGAVRFDEGGVRFPTGDVIPSFSLYPAATPFELRFQQLVPSALNVLVARTRPVAAGDFRALYLTDSTATTAARMGRVAEYGELPVVRFDTGENSIALKKYGRRIQISYEAVRRMAIDMLNWSIMYVAAKADADKEATAIDVLINGDAPRALTDKNIPTLTSIQLFRNTFDNMVAVDNSVVTANNLLVIDGNWAAEMVSEVGADIVQSDVIMAAQYNEINISETIAFDIATKGQNRMLAYTA